MFLRKVLIFKYCILVTAEISSTVLSIKFAYTTFVMVKIIPLLVFERATAYPVTKCVWVGRPYGHPFFVSEKPMHLNSMMKKLGLRIRSIDVLLSLQFRMITVTTKSLFVPDVPIRGKRGE